jgi:outer membrane protein TolC
MKRLVILIIFLFVLSCCNALYGQIRDSITLEQCYTLSIKYYPLTQQKELLQKINNITLQNLNVAYLPQLDFNAQATYQSDVVSIPIKMPGLEIPQLAKDQHKATIDVKQLIFDGGAVHQQKELQKSSLQIEQQKIEIELYKIKERINQLYFAILFADENLALNKLLETEIKNKIKWAESGIKRGILYPANADVLKAEMIKISQREIEITASRSAAVQMLAVLINENLPQNLKLQKPQYNITATDHTFSQRPEFTLFSLQEKNMDQNIRAINTKRAPKLSAFGQAGYGRPAFDIFNNNFQSFYFVGARLNWNIWNWNTTYNEKQISLINKDIIYQQKLLFEKNTKLVLLQQNSETEKYKALIEKDKEIISLRENIRKTASSQLENGVISATEFVTELNNENQAKLNLKMHGLQLLSSEINYLTTQGK